MARLLMQENDMSDIEPINIQAATTDPSGEDTSSDTEQITHSTSCDISKAGQEGSKTKLAHGRIWKKLFKWFVFYRRRNEST